MRLLLPRNGRCCPCVLSFGRSWPLLCIPCAEALVCAAETALRRYRSPAKGLLDAESPVARLISQYGRIIEAYELRQSSRLVGAPVVRASPDRVHRVEDCGRGMRAYSDRKDRSEHSERLP